MDAERFGRALGVGVRETARALWRAADAAASANPRAARPVRRETPVAKRAGVGVRKAGKSMLAPAVRAGSVLWFEVTGCFFGLFALGAGVEVWRRRMDFAHAGEPRERVCFATAMLLAFAWFTVQSFLKARRRALRA